MSHTADAKMAKPSALKPQESPLSSKSSLRRTNRTAGLDDPEHTESSVARLIEQLHAEKSSPHEKELITARLLGMTKAKKDLRNFVSSHALAMPLFINILRFGTPLAKVNVAATLSALCKDEDLQERVLVGGCIPPLLSLLKSNSTDIRKAAAEAIYEVSSCGLSHDHVGWKIFVTEGVVSTLWDELKLKKNQDKVVEGLITGALRNLCGNKNADWKLTLEAGDIDMIIGLLSSGNTVIMSNAASLLARFVLVFDDSISKVIDSGAVQALLQLLGQENDFSVRSSAAEALEALSSTSTAVTKAIMGAVGDQILIGAIVSPSKECMQSDWCQALQQHATRTLANMYGGMSALILHLGELSQASRLAAPVTDILGALAYTLMVFKQKDGFDDELFDAHQIENALTRLLKPRDTKLFQERVLEAMASLYGNICLSTCLDYADAKKALVGLIAVAPADMQETLIHCLLKLCRPGVSIWEAIKKREGIQLLMSLLALSSEQLHESAVHFLAILTDQVDDSKWAITAAGGIPQLVQLLEARSEKAKDEAAHVLWNLCSHSEDIRACVENAGAVPALLYVLKSGGLIAQETSVRAITKLIRTPDSTTINQLMSLLLGDSPTSKTHIIKVLGHVLTMASLGDLLQNGCAANEGLRSLVQVLSSSNNETQECAASVLADIFNARKDILDSLGTVDFVLSSPKLLRDKPQVVGAQLVRALDALSRTIKNKDSKRKKHQISEGDLKTSSPGTTRDSTRRRVHISEGDLKPPSPDTTKNSTRKKVSEGDLKHLIKLAKTGSIDACETAIVTWANLHSDSSLAAEAKEDVVSALTRVLEATLEDKRNASRAINQLVDLLRLNPDRTSCDHPVSGRLLDLLTGGGDASKSLMDEAGILDILGRYQSLGPQESTEAVTSELSRILFSKPDHCKMEAPADPMKPLIDVLRSGNNSAKYDAARELYELLCSQSTIDTELAKQAIQPLVYMLKTETEKEQEVVVIALLKLISQSSSTVALLTNASGAPLESLYRILSSDSSLELKSNVAQLCCSFFSSSKVRESSVASRCIEPLISLMQSNSISSVESGVRAFERLLDDEKKVEIAVSHNILDLLVSLISGTNSQILESSIGALIKLGKYRNPCNMQMFKAGVINKCLGLLPDAPNSLCSMVAELFCILTSNNTIAGSSAAASMVDPLFNILHRPNISLRGLQNAMRALVNIFEKPQVLDAVKFTPCQVIERLVTFLHSSQAGQQLGAELLAHLLEQEHFRKVLTTKDAVVPLVQLAGIGTLSLQQKAIRALETISASSPKAIADAGGIFGLTTAILQVDPQPQEEVLESAAFILCNLLRFNSEYYLEVPIPVLVKMLHSKLESTVVSALEGLFIHEKADPASAVQMSEDGAIPALLDLMRFHHCEDDSGRLLGVLLNNVRVREMKISQYALAVLPHYILDPETGSYGKLLAAVTLGNLSQNEDIARASHSITACGALITLLQNQPTEDMKMVVICALQNFVMNSKTNKRAVAEARGIVVIQDLLLSSSPDVSIQAAMLIKLLFTTQTLYDFVQDDLITYLTAVLDREMCYTAPMSELVLKILTLIITNFPAIRRSKAVTLLIPHFVNVLKSGIESAQDTVLDALCFLKITWSKMPKDLAKTQAMAVSEAIPILQKMVMGTCPPSFRERAYSLLHSLPGCLTITVKHGSNIKQSGGSVNAFCQLRIGKGVRRKTKVVKGSKSHKWEETLTWVCDAAPKGKALQIVCKNKALLKKSTLGKASIQIDSVFGEGVCGGVFTLNHPNKKKDGSSSSGTLDIEMTWSKMVSDSNEGKAK